MKRYIRSGEILTLQLRVDQVEVEVEILVDDVVGPSDGVLGRSPGGATLTASARWKVTEWQEYSLR